MRYALLIIGIYAAKAMGYCWVSIIGDSSGFQMMSKVIQFIFVFLAVRPLLKHPSKFIMVELLFMLMYFVSFLMGYAQPDTLGHDWIYGSLIYIPMGFAAYNMQEKRLLWKGFYAVSLVCFPLLIYARFALQAAGNTRYDMTFGYIIIVPILLFLYYFVERKNIVYLVYSVIGAIALLMYGSRGPFLCIFAFGLFILIFTETIKPRFKVVIIALAFFILYLLVEYWGDILNLLVRIADLLHVDSRTLNLLLSGEMVSHYSSRETIIRDSIQILNRSPLLGCGVASVEGVINDYPHNIFIEFLVNYGYFMGSLAIIFLIIVILKGVFNKESELRYLCIFFVALNMELLVSGSYLKEWIFYVCIGLCMSARKGIPRLILWR